jgi:hypothetical protein
VNALIVEVLVNQEVKEAKEAVVDLIVKTEVVQAAEVSKRIHTRKSNKLFLYQKLKSLI